MAREPIIDITKGIGIVLVILGHLVTYGSFLSSLIFSFHMPLFFSLVGYLQNNIENSQNTINRILKYILLYFEISIVGYCATLLVPQWYERFSWRLAIFDLFFKGQPESLHVGKIWFLLALSVSTVIFRSIAFEKGKGKSSLKILIFSLMIFFIIYIYMQYWIWIPLKIDVACAALPFVSFGYILKSKVSIIRYNWLPASKSILLIIMCLLIQITIVYNNGQVNICDMKLRNPLLFILGGLNGTIMIMSMAGSVAKIYKAGYCRNLLTYIGKNSMPIFTLHSFMLFLYEYIVSKLVGTNYKVMVNMTYDVVCVGVIFITTFCLILPVLYNCTLKTVNEKIIAYMTKNIV